MCQQLNPNSIELHQYPMRSEQIVPILLESDVDPLDHVRRLDRTPKNTSKWRRRIAQCVDQRLERETATRQELETFDSYF